jgi:hypothetical protein
VEPVIPDLAGRTIDIARVDWGLHLWTDDNWEILLSEPVLVTTVDADGTHQTEIAVDVEPQPLPLPLDGIEGTTILQLLVSRQGHLGITLDDRQLTVAPAPKYEAWQIAGHGELLICAPRGRLDYFPPLRRDADATSEDEPGEPADG